MNELIINKEDLIHNINIIKNNETKKDYTIFAVVKGNAYGLGVKEFTKILIENNINNFAVASFYEAINLRKYCVKEKILLLTPYTDEILLKELILNDITLTIDSKKGAEIVEKICKKLNKKVSVHIKIDTGLSRYGFDYNDTDEIKNIINESNNIIFEGIYSHFSNSLSSDNSFSDIQYSRFINLIDKLEKEKIKFKLKHICNSSGFFKFKDKHLNAARVGSAFIGCATGIKTNLKKIGLFHTRITKIRNIKKGDFIGYANSYKAKKNMKIAILETGYYDGIGLELITQRYKFKSKVKQILLSIKSLIKDDSMVLNINDNIVKVLGQIGMHDIVIDITGLELEENDDIYFYYRPVYINEGIKRLYK